MEKTSIKYLLSIFMTITLMTSCSGQRYYSKVVNNVGKFGIALSRILNQNMLVKTDSLLLKNGGIIRLNSSTCLFYENVNDTLLKMFMEKYQLIRICLSRPNDEFFDSVITFHKDYTPFIGKAVIVSYDFGKSGLREKTKKRIKLKDENIKIINDTYLYRKKSNPAFGE